MSNLLLLIGREFVDFLQVSVIQTADNSHKKLESAITENAQHVL